MNSGRISATTWRHAGATGSPEWTVSEEISAGRGPANSHELRLQQIQLGTGPPLAGKVSSIPGRGEGDTDRTTSMVRACASSSLRSGHCPWRNERWGAGKEPWGWAPGCRGAACSTS